MDSPLAQPAAGAAGSEAARALRVALHALKLGGDYAVKVRLPHALIMTALFGDAAAREPLALWRRAAGLAWQHGKGLALFAFVYKLAIGLGRGTYASLGLALSSRPGSPARPWHAAAAGALAANVAWSRYSHLGYQIVLYLLSRLIVGAVRHAAKRGVPPFAGLRFDQVYPAFAVATWATTMYLFETDAASLHPSLTQSMREIYSAADTAASAATPGMAAYIPRPATAAVAAWALWGAAQDLSAALSSGAAGSLLRAAWHAALGGAM